MKFLSKLLLSMLTIGGAGVAKAQATYCPIIPMPELPGGGGFQAIVAAIQHRLTYPPRALRAQASGRVFVSFVVTPSGRVREVAVVKHFRPDCDSAVARAVQQLPRFKPRRARYGNVRYIAPINFSIEGIQPCYGPVAREEYQQAARKATELRNSTR